MMSWGRNNLAPHTLLSVLRDPLSPFSAGLKLGRHLGPFGGVPPGRRQQAEYIIMFGPVYLRVCVPGGDGVMGPVR